MWSSWEGCRSGREFFWGWGGGEGSPARGGSQAGGGSVDLGGQDRPKVRGSRGGGPAESGPEGSSPAEGEIKCTNLAKIKLAKVGLAKITHSPFLHHHQPSFPNNCVQLGPLHLGHMQLRPMLLWPLFFSSQRNSGHLSLGQKNKAKVLQKTTVIKSNFQGQCVGLGHLFCANSHLRTFFHQRKEDW